MYGAKLTKKEGGVEVGWGWGGIGLADITFVGMRKWCNDV